MKRPEDLRIEKSPKRYLFKVKSISKYSPKLILLVNDSNKKNKIIKI